MTLDELRGLGVSVDEGLGRCMNNEDFYLKMIGKFLSDDKIDALGKALNEGDLDQAFELAHALKGVTSNLALAPLESKLSEITDLLRNRTQTDYSDIYESIVYNRDKLALLL
ncbi:Hpt domain-containing protein [Lachnospiraceae bacterium XBB2008]|nr:Hpt domain-containing protein [Lachnospiraceae bacterium XBB2008]